MGIHIHREGTPYNCGCCDIRERLMNLYDRTHAAVLDVNGITPDGDGHLFIPDIQDVTSLREDVEDLTESVDDLKESVEDLTESVDDLKESVEDLTESVDDLKEGEEGLITAVNQNAQDIQNTRQYAEGIGENVASIDTEIHITHPFVDTNSQQTISGEKTFTNVLVNNAYTRMRIDDVEFHSTNVNYLRQSQHTWRIFDKEDPNNFGVLYFSFDKANHKVILDMQRHENGQDYFTRLGEV